MSLGKAADNALACRAWIALEWQVPQPWYSHLRGGKPAKSIDSKCSGFRMRWGSDPGPLLWRHCLPGCGCHVLELSSLITTDTDTLPYVFHTHRHNCSRHANQTASTDHVCRSLTPISLTWWWCRPGTILSSRPCCQAQQWAPLSSGGRMHWAAWLHMAAVCMHPWDHCVLLKGLSKGPTCQ